MRSFSSLAVVLALITALGCKDKPAADSKAPEPQKTETETAAPAGSATDKPVPTPAEAESSPPVVTLLEPGAEPRRELRYAPTKGLKQTLVTTINLEVKTKLKGAPGPVQKMPPMIMTMNAEVVDSSAESFTYTFEIAKAETGSADGVPKVIADSIAKELGKVAGIKGKATVDNRGFTKEATLDVPDSVPPRMKQLMNNMQKSLEQLAAPLPSEAVGKGGKWKVEQSIAQSGMVLQQSSIFEVVSLGPDSAEVKVTVEQSAAAQPLQGPGLPPSTKLNHLAGTGKGRSKLMFAKIAPESSDVEVDTQTSLTVLVGDAQQTMETETKMTMTLVGK